jgi:hypothetical protein
MFKSKDKERSFRRVEVSVDEHTLKLLRMMGADGRISADHFMVRENHAILALSEHDIELLRRMGFEVRVGQDLLEQAGRVKTEKLARRPTVEADGLLSGFVSEYLDTKGILDRFQSLHAEFPALTQWLDLPYPTSGYDGSRAALHGPSTVKLFRITTTPASVSKPGLLLIAGNHAREWIPPLVAIEFTEQLLRTYTPGSSNPGVVTINQMVEGLDVLIVPAMNPDGINFSHHDEAMWRKNRRPNPPSAPAGCDGVDNNRNFSIYWGDAGSSGAPCNEGYRGNAAFSEPENQNVRYIIEQFPNILAAVDCHSFGEDIFRAQPTGGAYISSEPVEPRDHDVFLSLEAAMNAAISSVTPGKIYSTGTTNNHAGTCDDYLFLAHRIFGFTVECGQDFQPPIADGLKVVQEVAAALRALARETMQLATSFIFPVAVAHVIDRSGSMVASGYTEPALSNGRRMVDLMSLNDTVAVCSFNQAATTNLSRTSISDPGVFTLAKSAVNAIAFGGWTSIGAGLQAAGHEMVGVSGPKAIVLLSDGYQNRPPWVADVLPALPPGTRVHTIALGPQSDQALLQTIANATGGEYYFSPSELELHEIYNLIRAEAAGEELALNETVAFSGREADEVTLKIVVDEGAAHALISISWSNPDANVHITLSPPQGPITDLSRVRRSDGRAYKLLRIRRPQGGLWSITMRPAPGSGSFSCTAAAFLRSDVRLRLIPAARIFITGKPINVAVQILERQRPLKQFAGKTVVSSPIESIDGLVAEWKRKYGKIPVVPKQILNAHDALPKSILQAQIIRQRVRELTKLDPLRYTVRTGELNIPSKLEHDFCSIKNINARDMGLVFSSLDTGDMLNNSADFAIAIAGTSFVRGTHNIKVVVKGKTGGGNTFVRVGLRSIMVF